MFSKIKNHPTFKMITDVRNLGLYLLAVITLSVAWSSVKAIQKNYEIEKQITTLTQQVEVLEQETQNQALKNDYYKTDAFLELAARKYFGKGLPGEQFISVSTEIADKYTHPEVTEAEEAASANTKSTPKIIQNWEDWLNFFLNRD
jgi:cell division protein FtsB